MAKNHEIIQNPKSFHNYQEALWVELTPFEVVHQKVYSRKGTIIRSGVRGPTFRFLAPLIIGESINHSWEPYESIMSRLAGKIRDILKIKAEATGLKEVPFRKIATDITAAALGREGIVNRIAETAKEAEGAMRDMLTAGGRIEIPKAKVDSPLTYQDSTRRTYELTFFLIAEDDPESDIVFPVHELEKYSCADIRDLVEIELPWVFQVKSQPGNLINVEVAALTSVTPTYHSPYVDGYPIFCELSLSFTEVKPLYRENIKRVGRVRIVREGELSKKQRKSTLEEDVIKRV